MIKICLPTYREECIKPETRMSIERCIAYGGFKLGRASGTYIDAARNLLATMEEDLKVLDPIYEHYLYVDHDMEWSVDDVFGMRNRNVDIVCGKYARRGFIDVACAGKWHERHGLGWNGDHLSMNDVGLKPVDWCGAGFLLVTKKAMEMIEYPWFEPRKIEYKEYKRTIQDDVVFCLKAKEVGLQVHVDCDVKIEHLFDRIVCSYADLACGTADFLDDSKEQQILRTLTILKTSRLPIKVLDDILRLIEEISKNFNFLVQAGRVLASRYLGDVKKAKIDQSAPYFKEFSEGIDTLMTKEIALECKRPIVPMTLELSLIDKQILDKFVVWE